MSKELKISKGGNITTTGELRDFLAVLMTGVCNGTIGTDVAMRATKIAEQINNNFCAEIMVARARYDAGQTVTRIGDLPLGVAK